MTPDPEKQSAFEVAILNAVRRALEAVGLEAIRRGPFFGLGKPYDEKPNALVDAVDDSSGDMAAEVNKLMRENK